jgi:hypothetical protein
MKFVFKTVKMNIVAFWAITTCGFMGEHQCFEEISWLTFSSKDEDGSRFLRNVGNCQKITSESREPKDNNRQYQCSPSFISSYQHTERVKP